MRRNSKLLIIGLLVIIIIASVTYSVYRLNNRNEDLIEQEDSETEVNNGALSNGTGIDENSEIFQYSFDSSLNIIPSEHTTSLENIKGKAEELLIVNNNLEEPSFIYTSTEHLSVSGDTSFYVNYVGLDSRALLSIEEDAKIDSVFEKREEVLYNLGLGEYLQIGKTFLPIDIEYNLGEGLLYPEEYFVVKDEEDNIRDLSITDEYQLIYDTTIDLKIGNGLFIFYYNLEEESFNGIAMIDTDIGRKLIIRVTDYETQEFIISYMSDVVANGIKIIE